MEKKTKIIVIVAIVALVAWYLWKKGIFGSGSGSSSGSSDPGSSGVDLNSLESIIAASGMTSADANFVRKFAGTVESSAVNRQRMERKAADNGYTYAQATVLSALWVKYYNTEGGLKSEYDNSATKSYIWKVFDTVKKL